MLESVYELKLLPSNAHVFYWARKIGLRGPQVSEAVEIWSAEHEKACHSPPLSELPIHEWLEAVQLAAAVYQAFPTEGHEGDDNQEDAARDGKKAPGEWRVKDVSEEWLLKQCVDNKIAPGIRTKVVVEWREACSAPLADWLARSLVPPMRKYANDSILQGYFSKEPTDSAEIEHHFGKLSERDIDAWVQGVQMTPEHANLLKMAWIKQSAELRAAEAAARAERERKQREAEEAAAALRAQDAARAKNDAMRKWLSQYGLEQYAEASIDEGYDDPTLVGEMTQAEIEVWADAVEMKPGHKAKLMAAWRSLQDNEEKMAVWLREHGLDAYVDLSLQNGYDDVTLLPTITELEVLAWADQTGMNPEDTAKLLAAWRAQHIGTMEAWLTARGLEDYVEGTKDLGYDDPAQIGQMPEEEVRAWAETLEMTPEHTAVLLSEWQKLRDLQIAADMREAAEAAARRRRDISMKEWLILNGLGEHTAASESAGYDDVSLIPELDLGQINEWAEVVGMTPEDAMKLVEACQTETAKRKNPDMATWLASRGLGAYTSASLAHGYDNPQNIPFMKESEVVEWSQRANMLPKDADTLLNEWRKEVRDQPNRSQHILFTEWMAARDLGEYAESSIALGYDDPTLVGLLSEDQVIAWAEGTEMDSKATEKLMAAWLAESSMPHWLADRKLSQYSQVTGKLGHTQPARVPEMREEQVVEWANQAGMLPGHRARLVVAWRKERSAMGDTGRNAGKKSQFRGRMLEGWRMAMSSHLFLLQEQQWAKRLERAALQGEALRTQKEAARANVLEKLESHLAGVDEGDEKEEDGVSGTHNDGYNRAGTSLSIPAKQVVKAMEGTGADGNKEEKSSMASSSSTPSKTLVSQSSDSNIGEDPLSLSVVGSCSSCSALDTSGGVGHRFKMSPSRRKNKKTGSAFSSPINVSTSEAASSPVTPYSMGHSPSPADLLTPSRVGGGRRNTVMREEYRARRGTFSVPHQQNGQGSLLPDTGGRHVKSCLQRMVSDGVNVHKLPGKGKGSIRTETLFLDVQPSNPQSPVYLYWASKKHQGKKRAFMLYPPPETTVLQGAVHANFTRDREKIQGRKLRYPLMDLRLALSLLHSSTASTLDIIPYGYQEHVTLLTVLEYWIGLHEDSEAAVAASTSKEDLQAHVAQALRAVLDGSMDLQVIQKKKKKVNFVRSDLANVRQDGMTATVSAAAPDNSARDFSGGRKGDHEDDNRQAEEKKREKRIETTKAAVRRDSNVSDASTVSIDKEDRHQEDTTVEAGEEARETEHDDNEIGREPGAQLEFDDAEDDGNRTKPKPEMERFGSGSRSAFSPGSTAMAARPQGKK